MPNSVFNNFPIQMEWLLRIFLAALCGVAIGYERATQRKSAGIRTHMVVAMASALFMIISKYGFMDVVGSDIKLDPSRIAASIVTGISFIGAGTILVKRVQVSGLTTAAGVWATSAIGTAIGAGMYWIGILSTIFLFVVQLIFHDDTLINALIPHIRFNIIVETDSDPDIISSLRKQLEDNHVEQLYLKILDASNDHLLLNVDGIIKNRDDENLIILALRKNDKIRRVTYAIHGK